MNPQFLAWRMLSAGTLRHKHSRHGIVHLNLLDVNSFGTYVRKSRDRLGWCKGSVFPIHSFKKKSKVGLCLFNSAQCAYWGVQVQLYHSSPWHKMEVRGQLQATAALPSGKQPAVPSGYEGGPRGRSGHCGDNSCTARNRTQTIQPVAIMTPTFVYYSVKITQFLMYTQILQRIFPFCLGKNCFPSLRSNCFRR